jgi:hypothetical protein
MLADSTMEKETPTFAGVRVYILGGTDVTYQWGNKIRSRIIGVLPVPVNVSLPLGESGRGNYAQSVCAGIEAATVAWHPLGWKPAWFSEIEKFPSAVLAHHYPTVPNYGDMTKFRNGLMNQSTFWSEELPVNPSALQDSEKDWMTRVATSCLPTARLLANVSPEMVGMGKRPRCLVI